MEQGDFAMRGSIVDLYPPGEDQPFRLDFFGETLETIRVFEPESQRSLDNREEINLYQASEIRLDDETVTRFRQGYIKQFGYNFVIGLLADALPFRTARGLSRDAKKLRES